MVGHCHCGDKGDVRGTEDPLASSSAMTTKSIHELTMKRLDGTPVSLGDWSGSS